MNHIRTNQIHSLVRPSLQILTLLGLLLGFLLPASPNVNAQLAVGGTVVAWGYNGDGQSSVLAGLDDVVAIAAGSFYSLAIRPADINLTADIVDVAPNTRSSSVSSIAITFSAPVTGFDTHDLGLSWNGIPLDLSSVVLSGSGSSYTLSGLDSLTKPVGAYTLALVANGSGIQDALGNALAGDAADTWTMGTSEVTKATSEIVDITSKTRSTSVDNQTTLSLIQESRL